MGSGNSKRRHGRDKPKAFIQQQHMPTTKSVPVVHPQPIESFSAEEDEIEEEQEIIEVSFHRVEITIEHREAPIDDIEPLPTFPAAHEPGFARYSTQRTPTPPNELTEMIDSLRQLFVQDRLYAARFDATRCGVCYLTYSTDMVTYREDDGCYICSTCAKVLGNNHIPMIRRQRP
jgi:hypothetical protein